MTKGGWGTVIANETAVVTSAAGGLLAVAADLASCQRSPELVMRTQQIHDPASLAFRFRHSTHYRTDNHVLTTDDERTTRDSSWCTTISELTESGLRFEPLLPSMCALHRLAAAFHEGGRTMRTFCERSVRKTADL